ncbi:MAG: RIP metalloprotease RseP [Pseudomonadota bacterium]
MAVLDFLIYTTAFLLAISLLVAVHEYGHYLVARLCGIKVLRFSIGFGRPIASRRWGKDQTEYCLSSLPLGGYVKMLDERETEVAPADRHRSFQAQPVWQRILVLLAGPAFNFLFVIVAFWLLYMIGVTVQKPIIGEIEPDSPAAIAGLIEGDTIVRVDGRRVVGWEKAFLAIIDDMVGDGEVSLDVSGVNGGERSLLLQVPTAAARLEDPGSVLSSIGFRPARPPAVLDEVRAGGAAADAGLAPGDRIVAVDGNAISSFVDLSERIRELDSPRPLAITYVRDGEERTVEVTPRPIEGNDGLFLNVTNVLPIGVIRFGPLEAIPAAVARLVEETGFTLRMLGRMVTGDVSVKNLSGPVSIAQFAGQAAERGVQEYVRFLAVISISLGLLNLFPVPMLDGGQIVYQSIEWLKGSPLSERAQLIGQQLGVVMLLGVMVFATYNDLLRLFGV